MKNSIRFVLLGSSLVLGACGGGAAESSGAASTSGGEHCDHCDHASEHGGDHAHCEHCEHAADGAHAEGCACEHHDDHAAHGDHAAQPAEVVALHDELAPVFHMEPGAARGTATCEHAASFGTHATTIAGVAAPADAAAWSAATTSLTDAAASLNADCAAGGANAEAQLETFHNAFHAVMEASH